MFLIFFCFFFLFLKLFPELLAFRAAGAGADLAFRAVLPEAFSGGQDRQDQNDAYDYYRGYHINSPSARGAQ